MNYKKDADDRYIGAEGKDEMIVAINNTKKKLLFQNIQNYSKSIEKPSFLTNNIWTTKHLINFINHPHICL